MLTFLFFPSRRWGQACLLGLAVLALAGCTLGRPVAPWEKGHLAKPIMSLEPDPLEAYLQRHAQTSREAGSGGYGVGGGGCGCN